MYMCMFHTIWEFAQSADIRTADLQFTQQIAQIPILCETYTLNITGLSNAIVTIRYI